MTTVKAADLPDGSVVVDDLKGIAWYAQGGPGEPDRWEGTGDTPNCSDSTIDYAIRHGAVVLREGSS